jgi:uncharacterized membrane protein YfcA
MLHVVPDGGRGRLYFAGLRVHHVFGVPFRFEGETMAFLYLLIGLTAGVASGLFGVGGGVLIVPALSLLAGFAQERAVGTSLAVLLPPVGLAAVLAYWHNGNVDWKAGILIAVGLFIGAWVGAQGAHKMGDHWLKLCFGFFLTGMGVWVVVSALKGTHLGDL